MQRNGLQKAPLAGAFLFAWLGLALATGLLAAEPRLVEVRHVIDGDSLALVNGQQVRLIGVNTPEMVGADDKPEPLAVLARTTLAELINRQPVRLVPGTEEQDRHRRLLAYIESADGVDVQERLLSEGLGFLVAIPPNLARLDRYRTAQNSARRSGRGVWGHPAFAPLVADNLRKRDPVHGFRQVRGTIRSVHSGSRDYYFKLSPGFQIKIAKSNWIYFRKRPQEMLRQSVVVRGWVTRGKHRLQMRVSHPAMIEYEH